MAYLGGNSVISGSSGENNGGRQSGSAAQQKSGISISVA